MQGRERPLVSNAASRKELKRASKIEDILSKQDHEDMRSLLEQPAFRRWVWQHLEWCRIFETTFDGHGSIMAFNEGMRNAGLRVLSNINEVRPDALIQMMNEAKRREEDANQP